MHVGLHLSGHYYVKILTKTEVHWKIIVKLPYIKFQYNMFNSYWTETCG